MEDLQTISQILKMLFIIVAIMFGISGIHFILYAKSPKYYFFILKIISRWKDTNWKLSAVFTVNKELDFFNLFELILCERYGKKNFRKTFNLTNKKLYEFSNFALTIQYDLSVSQGNDVRVELLFNNINVTYNGAKDMLRELRTLFNSLERRIGCSRKNYNLNIRFSSMNNPFYGLLIQRLGPEHIDYFECVFSLSIFEKKQLDASNENNYKISIYKDYISVNEIEFDTIEDVAKKCLLMG